MVSRKVVVAFAVLGDGISSAANDDVEPETRYHHLFPNRQLVKRKSDWDDLVGIDLSSSPCEDTPGWTDLLGNTCEWFEEKDEPGCPAYGALWGAHEHCCYCKSNSYKSTPESEFGTLVIPTLVPFEAPSDNPIEIQAPTANPATFAKSPKSLAPTGQPSIAHPTSELPSQSEYLTLLAQTPTLLDPSDVPSAAPTMLLTQNLTLYPSDAPSAAPTKQFLPGELLLSNKELGIQLSSGLEARLIASTGEKLKLVNGKKSSLSFHSRIDGAGIVDLGDRGYVYVSNSEEKDGGVYGIHFNLAGDIVDYVNLLNNTRRNCGGGLTAWNTWISCEEWKRGQCWQVAADPSSPDYLSAQKTMIGGSKGGRFESVATDDSIDESPVFFVTEDSQFGAMRRFQAYSRGWNSLHSDGDLTYLSIIDDSKFEWTKNLTAARESAYSYYQNSEGISFDNGRLYFTAKSTQKLFVLDLKSLTYELETTGLNFSGKGSFNAAPDQVIKGAKRFLYFTESGGKTPGVYVRDMITGKYMTMFEAGDERYLNDETVGIAFSPTRQRMYAGYQNSGVLIELRRTDGLPFP
eukprot:scaffold7491_cov142-Skeletonema_menzelii.AAC.2